jgi:3-oxoacyl-[acyl-carrier-protein] synthase-3
MLEDNRTVPVVEGRQVFRLATTAMPEIVREVLALHGLELSALSLLLMHQANLRINESVQKSLGLSDDRVFNNIQKYGNTTAATLPLVFHEAKAAGRVRPGDLVGFTALGAGVHWGAGLLRI